ncbi:SDR family oxidoreductase [Paenibacillus aurantiacus]|uniref:SDR family oxidoreductase n=1 Tax=Paenibacillus aurantiacus TaxID=1936118 RepID=A0ABV5KMB4_9BACL
MSRARWFRINSARNSPIYSTAPFCIHLFAREGADIAIIYLNEHADASETRERIRQLGRSCLTIAGDIGDETFCRQAIGHTLARFGRIDILINNAGELDPAYPGFAST